MKIRNLLSLYGDKHRTNILILSNKEESIWEWDYKVDGRHWYHGSIDYFYSLPKDIAEMCVDSFRAFETEDGICIAIITK